MLHCWKTIPHNTQEKATTHLQRVFEMVHEEGHGSSTAAADAVGGSHQHRRALIHMGTCTERQVKDNKTVCSSSLHILMMELRNRSSLDQTKISF